MRKSNQVFPGNAKKFQEMTAWCRQNLGHSHGPESSWHMVKRKPGMMETAVVKLAWHGRYWPGQDYMKGIEFQNEQIAFWAKMTWE